MDRNRDEENALGTRPSPEEDFSDDDEETLGRASWLLEERSRSGGDGPGGDAELTGLYFADAGQHLEHRLFVDHDVPRCRSRVTYKGALQGQDAHAVWIGDVLIRPEAIGTDTYEYNRNLVLTDSGRIAFRYADEIFSLGREFVDHYLLSPAFGHALRI